MFCIYLRKNSDLCHLQHKLIGFYNRHEKCLQRGTDWVFKKSGLLHLLSQTVPLCGLLQTFRYRINKCVLFRNNHLQASIGNQFRSINDKKMMLKYVKYSNECDVCAVMSIFLPKLPVNLISDIFVNCNRVVTRWQQNSTHLHTNSTQNDTIKQKTQNGTYIKIRIHKHKST